MAMSKRIPLSLLLLLATVSGCAGMTPDDNRAFRQEIDNTVHVNMSLTTAEQRLGKAGLSCDDRTSAPHITCTRIRDNLLPYSCVQRVTLTTDNTHTMVTAVLPKPIVCSGF